MIDKNLVSELLKKALHNGGDYAEIFYEDRLTNTLSVEDSEIEEVRTGFDRGLGIKVMEGDTISYAFTDDLNHDSLFQAAEIASSAVREGNGTEIIDLTIDHPDSPHQIEILPEDTELEEKARLLFSANQAAREVSEDIRQVIVGYIDTRQRVLIASSSGLFIDDRRVYTRLSTSAVAGRNGVMQTGSDSAGGHRGMELYNDNSPDEIGRKAGEMAVTMLNARPAPTGQMPVVVNHGFGGVLFHEACGHGLEADSIQKEASVYSGRVGEKVASDKVTAIDDATLPNEWGSYVIDDEGQPAQRTVLIEEGQLVDYMYDLRAAGKEDRPSTGNGRRQSFRHLPVPRMSNTYLAPGESKPEEIIGSLEQGFYAKNLGGGQVNTATGDFTFSVREGYLVKDGKVAEPVRGATLVGNGPSSLQHISMVGDDLEFSPGVCGKEGQNVFAAVGQPTILIDRLTVGGTEQKGE